MALELIYTSAPRGLKPNTSGFCTVAATAGISRQEMMKLEPLSGYEFVYNLSDARAKSNPANFAHTRVTLANETRSVLSRVAFAGADYSGRTNKIAHHVLLLAQEQHPAGPAEMMRRLAEGGFHVQWQQDPMELPAKELHAPPGTDASAQVGQEWKKLTGDAGWAGALAKGFRERRNIPAYVIFSPGTDLLPLFAESLSLLEPEERWQVCFATYYTTSPTGSFYHWRGVVAGSAAAREALKYPSATVINLTKSLGAAEDDPYSQAARNGTIMPAPKAEHVQTKKVAAATVLPQPPPEDEELDIPVAISDERPAIGRSGRRQLSTAIMSGLGEGPPQVVVYRTTKRTRMLLWILGSSTVILLTTAVVMVILLIGERQSRYTPPVLAKPSSQPNPENAPAVASIDNSPTTTTPKATTQPATKHPITETTHISALPTSQATTQITHATPEQPKSQPSPSPQTLIIGSKLFKEPLDRNKANVPRVSVTGKDNNFHIDGTIEQFVDIPPSLRPDYRLNLVPGKATVTKDGLDTILTCTFKDNDLCITPSSGQEAKAKDFVIEILVTYNHQEKVYSCSWNTRSAPQTITLIYGYSEKGDRLTPTQDRINYFCPKSLKLRDIKEDTKDKVISLKAEKGICQLVLSNTLYQDVDKELGSHDSLQNMIDHSNRLGPFKVDYDNCTAKNDEYKKAQDDAARDWKLNPVMISARKTAKEAFDKVKHDSIELSKQFGERTFDWDKDPNISREIQEEIQGLNTRVSSVRQVVALRAGHTDNVVVEDAWGQTVANITVRFANNAGDNIRNTTKRKP